MQIQYFPAKERGTKDGGWLKSNFFSVSVIMLILLKVHLERW